MPSDRFLVVAAKKAHLAALLLPLLVLWCCGAVVLWCGLRVAGCGLRVAGCGLRVAGCGCGKAVLGRVFVRPRSDELMDGAFFVRRAG